VREEEVDLVVGEQGAFVFGMARLTADIAFVLAGWERRWGWLDDVRRRRLGGSRGVLASSGEFLFETSHGSLQLLQLGALFLQLCLQPLTSGTGDRCCFCHAFILLAVRQTG